MLERRGQGYSHVGKHARQKLAVNRRERNIKIFLNAKQKEKKRKKKERKISPGSDVYYDDEGDDDVFIISPTPYRDVFTKFAGQIKLHVNLQPQLLQLSQ